MVQNETTQNPTPKQWWGSLENAKEWIALNDKRTQTGAFETNTTIQSQYMVISEVENAIDKIGIKNMLEVGAGDGRLIGALSERIHVKCSSIDINPELSKFVKKKYKKVKTHVGEVINLPFKSGSFDLVFTYQVLQHVPPEEIEKAVHELMRVAKKEVWMWEGIGKVPGYQHGDRTHGAHGGSWVWHIEKIADCYNVSIPTNDNIQLTGQRLYKIKVK